MDQLALKRGRARRLCPLRPLISLSIILAVHHGNRWIPASGTSSNGASGWLVEIVDHNVVLEFSDEVTTGDPWTITDGKQIKLDGGSVGCDDQRGNVL